MSRLASVCCVAVVVYLAGGCATVLRGDKQKIKFVTDPSAATVTLNGGPANTTPFTATLQRKIVYDVVVSKPEYQAIRFKYEARWDGATMGNAPLPGGSAMLATDRVTGADLSFATLKPIKLERSPMGAASTQPALRYHLRGVVMTKDEYDAQILKERANYNTDSHL